MITLSHGNLRIGFCANSNLSLTLWASWDWDGPAERFARAFLKHGDMVIDAGANIGTFACAAAASIGPDCAFYAFEAHPETFANLRKTAGLNGFTNVSCHNVALSDRSGPTRTSDIGRKDDNNRLLRDLDTGLPVEAGTLAGFIGQHGIGRINLLKIDVEGHELAVLEGLGAMASRLQAIRIKVMENTLARYGHVVGDLHKWLVEHGFLLYRLRGETGNLVALRNLPSRGSDVLGIAPLDGAGT